MIGSQQGGELVQCTPEELARGAGGTQRGIGNVEEASVPETPELEARIPLPTQVSSPRNRKRTLPSSDEADGIAKEDNIPVVRTLMITTASGQQPRGSPFPKSIRSIQACADLVQPHPTNFHIPVAVPHSPPANQLVEEPAPDKLGQHVMDIEESQPPKPPLDAQKKARIGPDNDNERATPESQEK